MDDFNPVLDEFRHILSTLSSTKSSIANATKFCLQNANLWPRMFAMLQVELDELPGLEEKINLLYLFDSVCKKNVLAIRSFVASDGRLRSVFMRVFVEGERTRRAEEIFGLVEKILTNWKHKSLMDEGLVDYVIAEMARRLPVRPGDAEVLKWIDEDRRARKQTRIEKCFMPTGHDTDDEFDAMWEAVDCHGASAKEREHDAAVPGAKRIAPAEVRGPKAPPSVAPASSAGKHAHQAEKKDGPSDRKSVKRPASPPMERNEETKRPVTACRIWDLDETLIIFNTLLAQKKGEQTPLPFAERHLTPKPVKKLSGRERKHLDQKIKEGHALADELEDLLFDTMEGRFFDNDLNMLSAAIQHIDKYADFDDKLPLDDYDFENDGFDPKAKRDVLLYRRVAYRLRRIGELYDKARMDPRAAGELLVSKKPCGKLREGIDTYTKGWIRAADLVLKRGREQANSVDVIVSCSELIPALIKLLAFDLAKYFPSENVYNAHNSMDGKRVVFKKIMERFGSDCKYTAIGDTVSKEIKAAESTRQITDLASLKLLAGQISNGTM